MGDEGLSLRRDPTRRQWYAKGIGKLKGMALAQEERVSQEVGALIRDGTAGGSGHQPAPIRSSIAGFEYTKGFKPCLQKYWMSRSHGMKLKMSSKYPSRREQRKGI